MLTENHGLTFSSLIVGCMRLGVWGAGMSTNEYERFIDECLELGINDFDHADIYGHYTTEAEFGAVLKRRSDLRQKVQITTKCGIKLLTPNRPNHKIKSYDASAKHITASAEQSLKDLGIECIDLLLIHRPDYLLHPEEVAQAFDQLKKEGKARYFGVSNFTPSQFELLNAYTPLVTNQIEASLLQLDPFNDGTLDQCLRHKIRPTAWSPLGGGAIFTDSEDEQATRIRTKAKELAEKHSAGLDQIMLAWLMKHPSGIIPVLGTSKSSRVASAVKAKAIELTHEEWYELWQASTGVEIP